LTATGVERGKGRAREKKKKSEKWECGGISSIGFCTHKTVGLTLTQASVAHQRSRPCFKKGGEEATTRGTLP